MLDLGVFAAIQALEHQQPPSNVDELFECVESALWSLKREKLDATFMSSQQAVLGISSVHVDNTYELTHMGNNICDARDFFQYPFGVVQT